MAFLPDDLSLHRPMAGLELSPLVGVAVERAGMHVELGQDDRE